MKCKCKYYLMNSEGTRVCSQCGEPSSSQPIEDKMVGRHQTKKAPLYVSAKDRQEA